MVRRVRLVLALDDEDEEEKAARSNSGQNAYFASPAFRGLPSPPHGGTQTVTADQTLGLIDLCWCGGPKNHDWPGKNLGAPHPREEEPQVATQEELVLGRRDLRAYHRDLQDLVITATTRLGCTFRLGRNNVILYPPDGSPPFTVHARNSQRQVESTKLWLAKHTSDPSEPKREDLEVLAKRVNNPDEHPPKPHQEPQEAAQGPSSPSAEGTPGRYGGGDT